MHPCSSTEGFIYCQRYVFPNDSIYFRQNTGVCASTFGRNCSCSLICFKQCTICFEAPLTNILNSWVSNWLWALRPAFVSNQLQEFISIQSPARFRSQLRLSGLRYSRIWCRAIGRQVSAFCRNSLPKFTSSDHRRL